MTLNGSKVMVIKVLVGALLTGVFALVALGVDSHQKLEKRVRTVENAVVVVEIMSHQVGRIDKTVRALAVKAGVAE